MIKATKSNYALIDATVHMDTFATEASAMMEARKLLTDPENVNRSFILVEIIADLEAVSRVDVVRRRSGQRESLPMGSAMVPTKKAREEATKPVRKYTKRRWSKIGQVPEMASAMMAAEYEAGSTLRQIVVKHDIDLKLARAVIAGRGITIRPPTRLGKKVA